jgi:hypothetical protein
MGNFHFVLKVVGSFQTYCQVFFAKKVHFATRTVMNRWVRSVLSQQKMKKTQIKNVNCIILDLCKWCKLNKNAMIVIFVWSCKWTIWCSKFYDHLNHVCENFIILLCNQRNLTIPGSIIFQLVPVDPH